MSTIEGKQSSRVLVLVNYSSIRFPQPQHIDFGTDSLFVVGLLPVLITKSVCGIMSLEGQKCPLFGNYCRRRVGKKAEVQKFPSGQEKLFREIILAPLRAIPEGGRPVSGNGRTSRLQLRASGGCWSPSKAAVQGPESCCSSSMAGVEAEVPWCVCGPDRAGRTLVWPR